VLTFSSAGFFYLFLGLLFITVKFKLYPILITKVVLFHLTALVCLVVFFDPVSDGVYYFVEGISDKIFLNSNYKSVNLRVEAVKVAFFRFQQAPIMGHGLGLTSSLGEISPMSWYLILLTNGGLGALLSFMIFAALKLHQVTKIKSTIGIYLSCSVVVSFLTLSTAATFFNPFLWALLGLISLYRYSDRAIYLR